MGLSSRLAVTEEHAVAPEKPERALERMPDAATFLFRTPLYREYDLPDADVSRLIVLQYYSGKSQSICPVCGKDSILQGRHSIPAAPYLDRSPVKQFSDRRFDVGVECTWGHNENMLFSFQLKKKKIQKIGQWPSLADFVLPGIAQFRKLLGPERYADLSRAIGLSAHGIGAGSFVYLRRVFESLIAEARAIAEVAGPFDACGFERARMDEKILLLKDYLPAFLVKHRAMYGILSKGVHELSEQDCLLYFDSVRAGIQVILEEHLEAEAKASRIKEASHAIQELQRKLQPPNA